MLKIKIDCEMSDSTDFDGKQNVLDVKELHQSSWNLSKNQAVGLGVSGHAAYY